MGTLTFYVGALDAAKSCTSGSAGFSWINIIYALVSSILSVSVSVSVHQLSIAIAEIVAAAAKRPPRHATHHMRHFLALRVHRSAPPDGSVRARVDIHLHLLLEQHAARGHARRRHLITNKAQ